MLSYNWTDIMWDTCADVVASNWDSFHCDPLLIDINCLEYIKIFRLHKGQQHFP